MSTLGSELKEKDFEESSTAVPTPLERSTTNSSRNSKESLHNTQGQQDGAALEQVQSALYPGPAKLIPILVAICLSVFLVALDMTIVATGKNQASNPSCMRSALFSNITSLSHSENHGRVRFT